MNAAQRRRLEKSWAGELAQPGWSIGEPYDRYWGQLTHCGAPTRRVDLMCPDDQWCGSHKKPPRAASHTHAWVCACETCDWVSVWTKTYWGMI